MERLLYMCAAVAGFLGVAFGAFGAHALRTRLSPDLLAVFETGVRYQMYHTIMLVILVILHAHWPRRFFMHAYYLFLWGMICFSGSL